tara:strand:- start:94 stop:405 length:312 start_codon:yes stop_codon:yes gene_type:complete
MIRTIKDFYQKINDLQIDGYNAPIKLFFDGEEFFVKEILLKNNEIDGTFCSIELESNRSSVRENLVDLIAFFEKNFDGEELQESDEELKKRAVEGINKIKKIL